jgi:hypothetical protein
MGEWEKISLKQKKEFKHGVTRGYHGVTLLIKI